MIAKMARFDWEIPHIQRETKIYSLLEGTGIAPRFLGHIREQGRVIGILLEKVMGRHAGIEDLQICCSALRRLHGLGISHGDCNRYNFIVGIDNRVTLVDFENSTVGVNKDAMESEIAKLNEELTEESGRGGGFMLARHSHLVILARVPWISRACSSKHPSCVRQMPESKPARFDGREEASHD